MKYICIGLLVSYRPAHRVAQSSTNISQSPQDREQITRFAAWDCCVRYIRVERLVAFSLLKVIPL